MKKTTTLLILFLGILPAMAQTAFTGTEPTTQETAAALPRYAPTDAPNRSFGLGWWTAHGTDRAASGAYLNYTHDHFQAGFGYDAQAGRIGYILAGPGIPVPAIRLGNRSSLHATLHAVCGVTDFETGRFDYGGTLGLGIRTRKFSLGIQGQYTRHTAGAGLQIGF